MNMVERVARILCDELNDASFDELPEIVSYAERKTHVNRAILDKFEAKEVARAAIEAMREPTEGMIAGTWDAEIADNPQTDEHCVDIYRAMIDAALKEDAK